MKIGIVSYNFLPVINPRSFRTVELAKEFAKRGHEVSVYIPENSYNYAELEGQYSHLKIIKVKRGFYLNKYVPSDSTEENRHSIDAIEAKKKGGFLKSFKAGIIRMCYPGGFNFEYAFTCAKVLKKDIKNFDLLLSIGLPINSHVAVQRAHLWRKGAKHRIADYGDPYSLNQGFRPPKIHFLLEKRMLKKFHHVLIPTEKMKGTFEKLVDYKKILVIPQALDLDALRPETVTKTHDKLILAYAGNFYAGIRNPNDLLEYLSQSRIDFELRLYTNVSDKESYGLIAPFIEQLGDRLVINNLLPRQECIQELSQADILINIANTTSDQIPSKLIDYKLAGKPIFSYQPGSFDSDVFQKFLNKDFKHDISDQINLSDFDIRLAVDKILDLVP